MTEECVYVRLEQGLKGTHSLLYGAAQQEVTGAMRWYRIYRNVMTGYEKEVEEQAFPKPSAGPDLLGTLGPSDNDAGVN